MNEKTAVILAGGKGTRLYPYTVSLPKPLVPVGDKPILEIMIIRLAKDGFKKIIITVNHQADIIMAYFGDGKKWDVSIEYSLEDIPLGTMGPLKLIKDLPEHFLVMNGDVLTDMSFSDFLNCHIRNNDIFTVSSYKRTQKSDYGVLEVDNSVLTGFKEKPTTDYTVSMGIYAVSSNALEYIPDNQYFGFDKLMELMLGKKIKVGVYDYNGYWMDIGLPNDYAKATEDVLNGTFQY